MQIAQHIDFFTGNYTRKQRRGKLVKVSICNWCMHIFLCGGFIDLTDEEWTPLLIFKTIIISSFALRCSESSQERYNKINTVSVKAGSHSLSAWPSRINSPYLHKHVRLAFKAFQSTPFASSMVRADSNAAWDSFILQGCEKMFTCC